MRSKLKCALIISCFIASLSSAGFAADDEKVTLNFVNADIASVIKAVGEMTGKNFILDPRVNGTVNIISAKPVSRDLTYQILLSALRLQGFTAIEAQGVTKILPEADAKQNAGPTVDKDSKLSGDRIITQVYPLQFEQAAPLVPILRPLITPNNTIAVYPNTNTLVITDYADNIKRISKIIEAIDRPANSELVVINLQYASAVDLAQILAKLAIDGAPAQAGAGGVGGRLSIVADPRSNSLVVRAEHPSYVERVRTLVKGMDVPVTAGGSIHVVHLRNADAAKIAETLRAILTGDSKSAQTGASQSFAPGTSLPGTPSLGSTQPGTAPSTNPATPLVAPPGTPPAFGGQPATPGGAIASITGQGGFIQADVATNSLIIAAPDNVYNSLRAVIDQLDSRRAQVHLEALIAEVATNKAAEFGIQFQDFSGLGESGTSVVGGTNFSTTPGSNIIGVATNPLSAGSGLNIGLVRGRITVGGVEIINLGVLARALEGDRNSNVLSTPNLLSLDNEEAKIVVGQNVPFVTGSFAQAAGTGTGAAVNPFQTIDRRDVGLTLKIKPSIAEGGTIKMQIFQEVSSIAPTTTGRESDLITNKRSIESTVLVDDGQIIVLGGLIQDTVQNNIDKIPLLGDIPGIGNLFRYESRSRGKTNLMVFLRPVVLQEAVSGASLTSDRYEYIRNEQGKTRVRDHFILPDLQSPQLPPLPDPNIGEVIPKVAPPAAFSPGSPQPGTPAK